MILVTILIGAAEVVRMHGRNLLSSPATQILGDSQRLVQTLNLVEKNEVLLYIYIPTIMNDPKNISIPQDQHRSSYASIYSFWQLNPCNFLWHTGKYVKITNMVKN